MMVFSCAQIHSLFVFYSPFKYGLSIHVEKKSLLYNKIFQFVIFSLYLTAIITCKGNYFFFIPVIWLIFDFIDKEGASLHCSHDYKAISPTISLNTVSQSKTDKKFVNCGCFQIELTEIPFWKNEYRPKGRWAYYTYGTADAYEYAMTLEKAYAITHKCCGEIFDFEAIEREHMQKAIIFSAYEGQDCDYAVDYFFNSKTASKDNSTLYAFQHALRWLFSNTRFARNYTVAAPALQPANAYYSLVKKWGCFGFLSHGCVALCHQIGIDAYLVVGRKPSKIDHLYWVAFYDRDGVLWHYINGFKRQEELSEYGIEIIEIISSEIREFCNHKKTTVNKH